MNDKEKIATIVSRETMERLEIFAEILIKWNPTINLVGKSTIQALWSRHMLDSIQFYDLIPQNSKNWVDLGSGGGFPGLVLAILALERKSPPNITLIESDKRKSVFLRTVIRETGIAATILTSRIEETPGLKADVLTARALADLKSLLSYSSIHLEKNGTALFAKGKNWKNEASEALKMWQFQYTPVKSKTDSDAVILKIQGISHVR